MAPDIADQRQPVPVKSPGHREIRHEHIARRVRECLDEIGRLARLSHHFDIGKAGERVPCAEENNGVIIRNDDPNLSTADVGAGARPRR
jgi:hypothetical protein